MNGTYIYILQSSKRPERRYVGMTRDIDARLEEHNDGLVESTWRFRPWKLVAMVWLADRAKAEAFERYLKHGSGHAFSRRHF
jgi:predicted GIY-YIG superfamily endonuclease